MDKYGQYPSTSISLFRGSLNFFDGAKIIQKSGNQIPALAFGLLLAHSLELVLKAFLLSINSDEEKLRKKLGHDLVKAWNLSVENGLNIEATVPNWCEILNGAHNVPYHYRYAKINTAIVVPPPAQTIDDLGDVLLKVGKKLGLDMQGNFIS